ncbi:DUF4190 domain-containing protein [Mycolicibacterium flavescens]|uniref:DUF4190 domain-containing protein n=1 Tax=Mycolicibacterium flavescens TaxID=1776 RepID=A0A1E3RGI8_MYCFV|nr:DUF4190 domain-containing protein [Mycolicibacterium flavescens]MCV7280392.1 DUF4190 domain-containing protein [Mycolicibacterium flavescens]ODQ88971.1 hypothetical protein BHQ18_17255 [Mycolicibacterium flavescens]
MTATGGEPPDGSQPFAPVDYPEDAALPPPVPQWWGYPPASPYGYAGYPPAKPPGTNGKAIGALVASALGIVCCGMSAIAGVILGIVAMRETRRSGQDGFGIALAATIIGGLAVLGYLLYLLLYVAVFASGWQWT